MKGCKKVVTIVFPIKTIKDLVFFKIDTMFLFLGEIPGGPCLGFWAFIAVALVQSLVGDERPHKSLGWQKKDLLANTSEIIQFSSVTQLCPTLCDPSMSGLPVHHQLPEFTQTHAHRVGDAIQPSHPLSSPSPPAPNPSKHQGLLK